MIWAELTELGGPLFGQAHTVFRVPFSMSVWIPNKKKLRLPSVVEHNQTAMGDEINGQFLRYIAFNTTARIFRFLYSIPISLHLFHFPSLVSC